MTNSKKLKVHHIDALEIQYIDNATRFVVTDMGKDKSDPTRTTMLKNFEEARERVMNAPRGGRELVYGSQVTSYGETKCRVLLTQRILEIRDKLIAYNQLNQPTKETTMATAKKSSTTKKSASSKKTTTSKPKAVTKAATAKPTATKSNDSKKLTLKSAGSRTITVLAEKNPKREGTEAYKNFSKYKTGMTVEAFVKAGGSFSDLRYDLNKGYVSLSEVVKEESAAA